MDTFKGTTNDDVDCSSGLSFRDNGVILTEYSKDVLSAIFLRCDPKALSKLSLVCKRFNDVISESSFIIAFCEFHGITLPSIAWRRFVCSMQTQNPSCIFDYHMLLRHDPFRENLCPPILNSLPEMVENYGWEFLQDGGGLKVERPPIGCKQHDLVEVAFATSYGECGRIMKYDFSQIGVQDWVMDRIRPRIVVREWMTAREDCGSEYTLLVQLLPEYEHFGPLSNARLTKRLTKRFRQWGDGEFVMAEIVIENYPIGMRKLIIQSRGADTQIWAGHFGSKFGNTQVRLELPDECRYLTEADFFEYVNSENEDDSSDSENECRMPRRLGRQGVWLPPGVPMYKRRRVNW